MCDALTIKVWNGFSQSFHSGSGYALISIQYKHPVVLDELHAAYANLFTRGKVRTPDNSVNQSA